MNDNNWERGIVVGETADRRLAFIATPRELAVCHRGRVIAIEDARLSLGNSVEIVFEESRSGRKPEVLQYRRAPYSYCETIIDEKGVQLICQITGYGAYKFIDGMKTPTYETNYLQEIYDNRNVLYRMKTDELKQVKVICKRVCIDENTHWVVQKIARDVVGNNDNNHETRQSDSGIFDTFINNPPERTRRIGFVPSVGNKHRDELYIWVPGRLGKRDIIFRKNFRQDSDRNIFVGRWVEFTTNWKDELDIDSDVQIVRDVLPTRKCALGSAYEVLLDCTWDKKEVSGWDSDVPILWSDDCGKVADPNMILKKYDAHPPFSCKLWVYFMRFDLGVYWVLSDVQNEIEQEKRNSRRNDDYEQFPRRSENRNYDNDHRVEESDYYRRSARNQDDVYSSSNERMRPDDLRNDQGRSYQNSNYSPIYERNQEDREYGRQDRFEHRDSYDTERNEAYSQDRTERVGSKIDSVPETPSTDSGYYAEDRFSQKSYTLNRQPKVEPQEVSVFEQPKDKYPEDRRVGSKIDSVPETPSTDSGYYLEDRLSQKSYTSNRQPKVEPQEVPVFEQPKDKTRGKKMENKERLKMDQENLEHEIVMMLRRALTSEDVRAALIKFDENLAKDLIDKALSI